MEKECRVGSRKTICHHGGPQKHVDIRPGHKGTIAQFDLVALSSAQVGQVGYC